MLAAATNENIEFVLPKQTLNIKENDKVVFRKHHYRVVHIAGNQFTLQQIRTGLQKIFTEDEIMKGIYEDRDFNHSGEQFKPANHNSKIDLYAYGEKSVDKMKRRITICKKNSKRNWHAYASKCANQSGT